jgi:1,4-dihydroxy-2-naphthoate polyprenyltransferase
LSCYNETMHVNKLKSFIILARPFFLLGGLLLYLIGVSIAASTGIKFDPLQFVIGLLLVSSIQLMVHLANEYFDREVDRSPDGNKTWFTGGSGVLSTNTFNPEVALKAALTCGAFSIILLVVIAFQNPWLALLGVLEIVTAWFYSAPPIRLVSRGLGELVASLILCFFVPFTGIVLQNRSMAIPSLLIQISLPLTLISMAMLIAFEFPDIQADTANEKRTLTVRLGIDRAAWLHHGLVVLAFLIMGGYSPSTPEGMAGRLVYFALPLAAWQIYRVSWQIRHPQSGFPVLTLGAVGLFGLTGFLWLLGFWI